VKENHQLHTEHVEYTDGTTSLEGYISYDASSASPAPCVLVTHDWSGLNQGIRAITDKLARLGYIGFALDVYGKGIRGSETGDNSALMNPLLADRSLLRRRLLAGLAAATRHARVDRHRIVVVGYCFGGLCALDLARAAPPELKGAVSFHGLLTPPGIGEQPTIKASVLILHGWEDPVAPPADVLGIAEELTAAKADWSLHAYGHAHHAFTFQGANMPERGILYNAPADRRSWAALVTFLCEVLA
jgi:dienelactone hydrolase